MFIVSASYNINNISEICTHKHTHKNTHTEKYVHTHTHTNTHMHTHTHTHTHLEDFVILIYNEAPLNQKLLGPSKMFSF